MLQFLVLTFLLSLGFIFCTLQLDGKMGPKIITWEMNSLDKIGENRVTIVGAPKLIETPQGKAVQFDGQNDGLLIHSLPLAGWKEFTLEVIFRPDADGLKEQRFFHMQETESENRVLMETRLTGDNRWFLDTYIRSGKTDETLYAEKFLHPIGPWYQAALVFDGKEMRHYVNAALELSSPITFTSLRQGQTSLGVRLNKVYWFKGAIRKVRFSPRALQPQEFLRP